jgi:arabinogalactan endo-1,4-beta-galactosidase|tara:strand:- start:49 stop:360 length:312 start_codon:yes stop_codon:yes gene_type:complete
MYIKYIVAEIIGILTLFLQFRYSLKKPFPSANTNVPHASDAVYKGTNMAYVSHQKTYGNVVFKENDVAKDAFQRIANHDRNIVRLRIDNPPYNSNYTAGLETC